MEYSFDFLVVDVMTIAIFYKKIKQDVNFLHKQTWSKDKRFLLL